jgi:hypothetical protein
VLYPLSYEGGPSGGYPARRHVEHQRAPLSELAHTLPRGGRFVVARLGLDDKHLPVWYFPWAAAEEEENRGVALNVMRSP